jgi:tetratricopeptide (TPR) repeat protein
VGRNEHLRLLDAEIDNLHAALDRALDDQRAADALALCVALGEYWLMRHHYARTVESIGQALALPGADAHPRLRVVALCNRHRALGLIGHREAQAAGLADAEATARELGDPVVLARALEIRSGSELTAEWPHRAIATADEAIALVRDSGDEWEIARAVEARARAANTREALRTDVELAARLLEGVGDVYDIADLLASSAYSAVCIGLDHEAMDLITRAVPIARQLDSPFVSMVVQGNLGMAALLTGDVETANGAFREELRLGRTLSVVSFATEGLEGLAAVAVAQDDLPHAARLYGAAKAHRYGMPPYPVEERLWRTVFEPGRRRLGEGAWDHAADDGAAMSHDAAVGYALAGS